MCNFISFQSCFIFQKIKIIPLLRHVSLPRKDKGKGKIDDVITLQYPVLQKRKLGYFVPSYFFLSLKASVNAKPFL